MIFELQLYSPHSKQLDFHKSKARFLVAAWGRQSGKSTAGVNHLLKEAWENANTRYWFVSPTYAQARVMYRRLEAMLWNCRDAVLKKNQTELRIKMINNSEIRFVSGDAPDSLRGETLNGVIIDEVRDQHAELWPMVIRPMLTTTKGWAKFISTPAGFDHFYDLAKLAQTDKDWAFMSAPSTANPLFTSEEFEAAQKSMSESQFAQEILAEFRDLTAGRAYMFFGEHNYSEECPWMAGKLWSPYHPIVVGMDFNLSPMAWTIGQMSADRWWWFDEIHLSNSHTQEAAIVLRDKILALKDQGYRAPQDLILCGDATGKATQRTSNQSDYDIVKSVLKCAGLSFSDETPEANPSVKDRVNAVNAKLKGADGSVSMWIHPTYCRNLVRDLERVVWKPGANLMLDQSRDVTLTHASDSIGYPIHKLTPIKGVRSIGQTRIIQRSF